MDNKIIEGMSALTTIASEVVPDILAMDFTVVTACIIGKPNEAKWVLIDTGLENSEDFILECAEKRYGQNSRPEAIILTHGHFDHVGSVISLSDHWSIPIYAHKLEMPYITGKKDYPVPDYSVDTGFVAKMSPTFPHTSINISHRASELQKDGSIPGMSDWKWIHTPGHTEGHISLFREKDRVLLVGDAFSTTKQESLLSVVTHSEQIGGPPKYLTTDWQAAQESVKRLKELKPSLAIPSHGKPMSGQDLTKHLDMLVNQFDEIAKPKHGRFVDGVK